MLASLNVILVNIAKTALVSYVEKRISQAEKQGDLSKECAKELKLKAQRDIDVLFSKIEDFKNKFLGESEDNKN